MANRRMFSLSVIDTDTFLEMPPSTQALYFHLAMRADDDGFISSPRKITKMINCGDDDLKILFSKGFIIPFDSGVCVIRDWLINNQIRKDRYFPTIHKDEKAAVRVSDSGVYVLIDSSMLADWQPDGNQMATKWQPDGNQMATQYSIGKDSIVKDSIVKDSADRKNNINNKKNNIVVMGSKNRFTKPTLEEVQAYCIERGNGVDAQHFIDYYEAKGWIVGKSPMKDWKAAVRTWERNSTTDYRPQNEATKHDGRFDNLPGVFVV